ncbi:MAG TPA: hypothetical protein VFL73_10730, partial [Solirubrobacteraceae bacterium]|nr:hypothetical protein [Solirubrobacteraceae bacterium]
EYMSSAISVAQIGVDRINNQVESARSLKEIVDGYNQTRKAIIDNATARGLGAKAAEEEADKIFMSNKQLDEAIARYAQLHPEVVTEVKTKGGDKAISQIQLVKGTIDGVPRIVDIKFGVIDAGVRAAISGITKALGPLGMPFNVLAGLPNFTPRAAGGFDAANAHQAEIAKGGAWRVWAEPETRGESYIPHANDWRRPRAKAILEQTARMFGGSVSYHAAGSLQKAPDYTGLRPAPVATLMRSSASIDYARFGREVAGAMPPQLPPIYSSEDAYTAARRAYRDEWRRRDG